GAALVYGGCMGSALKWFTKDRGFAAGVIAAGFGGGTALFIPFIASMIQHRGYRTAFLVTGIFQGIVILVVAQFLCHPERVSASDRIGRELAMGIAFALQAVCLVLVLTVGRRSGALFTATLILTYFTWGEIFSLFPSLVADYFGTRSATANYGAMYSAKGVASIIGSGVAAMLYEHFGTWSACFYGSAVLALMAAVTAFGLRA